MPSTIQNSPTPFPVSTGRGQSQKLGVIGPSAGSVVAWTLPEPTYQSQGGMIVQVGPGVTLGAGTFALEFSIDGGVSWAIFPTTTTAGVVTIYTLTGQPGSDTAAIFAASYTISGFGSGTQFRFGFVVAPTSGTSPVFVLYG